MKTLHMPFDKMSITLHNMELILGLFAYNRAVNIEDTHEQLFRMVNNDFDLRYIGTNNDSFARGGIGQTYIVHTSDDVRSHLLPEMRASCYVFSIIRNSLFTDKSRMSIVNYKLWAMADNEES